MAENKTTYFEKMMGGPFTPNSIVILSDRVLDEIILIHSYLNFLFRYLYGRKVELWEDNSWFELRHLNLLWQYHGQFTKYYRPTKIFDNQNIFDQGLRKLYDEFILRKSNRHSNMKRIIYLDSGSYMSALKPSDMMVEEILKDGGRKCNIQFITKAIRGSGSFDKGLLGKFDIRIATLPLGKKDSLALFGSDEYASSKEEDFVLFGYKNKVDRVPVFHHDPVRDPSDKFLELIRTWSF